MRAKNFHPLCFFKACIDLLGEHPALSFTARFHLFNNGRLLFFFAGPLLDLFSCFLWGFWIEWYFL
jgi:hypothetical protein